MDLVIINVNCENPVDNIYGVWRAKTKTVGGAWRTKKTSQNASRDDPFTVLHPDGIDSGDRYGR